MIETDFLIMIIPKIKDDISDNRWSVLLYCSVLYRRKCKSLQKTEYCEKLTAARDMEVELYKTKLQAAILDAQKCTQEKIQLQSEVLFLLYQLSFVKKLLQIV